LKAGAENYIIQTVTLALDLLELFQEDDDELSITDLSTRLKIHTNNVLRLVATLAGKNYLEKNNYTDKYRLGIMNTVLSQVALRQIDYATHVRPFLAGIKQQCLETCCFSVIKDGYTYYLDGVESDLPVHVVQRLGYSRPLYCTAAGRVQLAFMAPQEQIDLLSGSLLKKLTSNTITDPDMLHIELKKVVQNGYAIDDQEHDFGVVEIAAPVFDSDGAVIGALSIVGPEMRINVTRIEKELLPLVFKNAILLSTTLGNCRITENSPKTVYKYKNRIVKTRMIET
jgi:IclR family transcriptional regulator, KDG regulon repressor